jgi:hypothetical protein
VAAAYARLPSHQLPSAFCPADFRNSSVDGTRLTCVSRVGEMAAVGSGLDAQLSRGLSVKAVKGRAVVFWSQTTDGKEDPKSLHGGCTVVSGTKWSATRWIRTGKFV